MNQHDPETPPWPWPTPEEAEPFSELLAQPDTRVTQHRDLQAVHAEHPDGRSLWAVNLDNANDEDPRAPLPPSLIYPLVAESMEALDRRVTALQREARTYGMAPRLRSPLHRNTLLEAKTDALIERADRSTRKRSVTDWQAW